MDTNIGYIICETASSEPQTPDISIVNGRVEFPACVQDVNVKNRNGRFYEDKELIPKLKDERLVELINTGNLFGECSHPISQELSRQSIIDPGNKSHRIKKLWTEDTKVMADIRAAYGDKGDDFHNTVLDGTEVSFSLRALGSVVRTARGAEVRNLKIITWDWVVYPSHKTAYMVKSAAPGSSLVRNESGMLVTESAGICTPITTESVVSYIKEESKNIKDILKTFEYMTESISYNPLTNIVSITEADSSNIINLRLESHIKNEIMDFCEKIQKNNR